MIQKIHLLFNKKQKITFVGMLVAIMIGAGAEVLGVAAILPIIELATDLQNAENSKYCSWLISLLGVDNSTTVLLILIVITILLYVVKNLYLSWLTYQTNKYSKNIRTEFSIRLMRAYMKQPYLYFVERNSATILRTITVDTVDLYSVVASFLQFLSQGITALLIVAFLAYTDWKMTLFMTVIVLAGLFFVVFVIQKKMRRMGKKSQKLGQNIVRSVKQSFEGIKEVKIKNAEDYFINEYSNLFEQTTDIELKVNLFSIIPKYIMETICIGGILGYLFIQIILGNNITQMVVSLSVFAVSIFKLLPSVNSIYSNFSNMLFHKAAIDLIYDEISSIEVINDDSNHNRNCEYTLSDCIDVQNISFSYGNDDKWILNNVSLSIKRGESVAFIGESGSGKSTLADILLGLLSPQRGKILIDGKDIVGDSASWRKNIGYIPQNIFLLDDSIAKNVAFASDESEIDEERVICALEKASLLSFVNSLPNGINTMVGEAGAKLSGGQRQRIGIARALYDDPDILIFDEATSALDIETEQEVMAAINSLHGEKTMIIIAHRLSTIKQCDKVYCIKDKMINIVEREL